MESKSELLAELIRLDYKLVTIQEEMKALRRQIDNTEIVPDAGNKKFWRPKESER
jgi:hypothetical protein